MTGKYSIQTQMNNGKYKAIILSVDNGRVMDYLHNISENLKNNRIKGHILFDLEDCNGSDADNRFIEMYFDGINFIRSTAKIVENQTERIVI
jgi:hypothetical protein